MSTTLGKAGGRGALNGLVGQFGKIGVNFISLAVLARLLSPDDYGLIAMVVAIIGIADLFKDMGLSTASIQAKTLSDSQRSNLWWINTSLGALFGLIIALSAPVMAWFYGRPEILWITLALSFNFFISGASTQFRISLVRNLRMGILTIIDLFSSTVALLMAFIVAYSGGGYWAIVTQQLGNSIISLVLLSISAGWIPGRWDRTAPMRNFYSFGAPVFVSSVLTYLSQNLDNILVGRIFGTEILGQYNRAMQVVRIPMNGLRSPLNQVALSTLSKVQDEDEQFSRYVTKAQMIFLYPITFLGLWVAINAADLVPLVLGDNWNMAIPLLAIFAVGDSISNLSSAGSWIYLAKGRARALMKYTLISATARLFLFIIAVPFGYIAVGLVYAIAPIFLWPLSFYICARFTTFNTIPLFLTSLRVILGVGSGATIAWWIASFLPFTGLPHLLTTTLIYLSCLTSLLLFPIYRKDYRVVISTLIEILKR